MFVMFMVVWTIAISASIIVFNLIITIDVMIAHRTGRLPGACVFSNETALLFHGPPRSLWRVVAANCCETSHEANLVSFAWRGAAPNEPSIPARQLEPWMKHVLKHWEKWRDILYYGILGERWVLRVWLLPLVATFGRDERALASYFSSQGMSLKDLLGPKACWIFLK